jgi:hypothetical protein
MLEYNEGLLDLYRKDYPKLSSYFLDIVRVDSLTNIEIFLERQLDLKEKFLFQKR